VFNDPGPAYLESLARRALRLYWDRIMLGPNPLQRLIWNSGSYLMFIEAAATWPWDTRPRINMAVNRIMVSVLKDGCDLREAVVVEKERPRRASDRAKSGVVNRDYEP
jgi:hypothetical protein